MVFVAPEDYINATEDNKSVYKYKNKTPKDVLQFDDGILEEYSTEEEGEQDEVDGSESSTPSISELSWSAWLIYKVHKTGTSTLACIDYLGNHLAWFFGITSPKYYFEIEEAKRNKEIDDKELEMTKSWQGSTKDDIVVDRPVKRTTNSPDNVV